MRQNTTNTGSDLLGYFPRTHLRSLGFFNPERSKQPRVVLVGAGGIGSWTALALAKMGLRNITCIDPDVVEEHNLGTTPYTRDAIGMRKVEALQELVHLYGFQVNYKGKVTRYREGLLPKADVLISAVDSMDARRVLFREAIRQKIPFYIDGRIGGENLRVYAIRPASKGDCFVYKESLVPNERVMELPCTVQQIVYVGFIIAGLIARAVRHWVIEEKYNREIILKIGDWSAIVSPKQTLPCKRCQQTRFGEAWRNEDKETYHRSGHSAEVFTYIEERFSPIGGSHPRQKRGQESL